MGVAGGILFGLYLSTLTWNWWWTNHIKDMPVVFLPKWFGYGGAVALTLLALAGIVLLSYWWEYRSSPCLASRLARRLKCLR